MALKNGLDPKKFSNRIKAAEPAERRKLWANYQSWIAQGAKAQGWYGGFGFCLLGVTAFVISLCLIYDIGSLMIYIGCALAVFVGGLLVREASRRERTWRELHPFQY